MSHYSEQYDKWDKEIEESRKKSTKNKSSELEVFLNIQRAKVENLACQQQEIIDSTTAALNIAIKDKGSYDKLEDLIFDYLHNTREDDEKYSKYIIDRISEFLH